MKSVLMIRTFAVVLQRCRNFKIGRAVLSIVVLPFIALLPGDSLHGQEPPVEGSPFAKTQTYLDQAVDQQLLSANQRPANQPGHTRWAVARINGRGDKPLEITFGAAEMHSPFATFDVQKIFRDYGLPLALLNVAKVESNLDPFALSPKGARGLWQFMPATARRYGLRVDNFRDDRLDAEMSTQAAARYLRDLYEQFDDWPLALAAYNAGEQRVQRAIQRSHGADFWALSATGQLPKETRDYIPSIFKAMRSTGDLSNVFGTSPRSKSRPPGVLLFATPAPEPRQE